MFSRKSQQYLLLSQTWGLRERSQGGVQRWSGWKDLGRIWGSGSALGLCSLTCPFHGQGIRQWVGPGVQGCVVRLLVPWEQWREVRRWRTEPPSCSFRERGQDQRGG